MADGGAKRRALSPPYLLLALADSGREWLCGFVGLCKKTLSPTYGPENPTLRINLLVK